MGQFHLEESAALLEPLIMLFQAEDIYLFFLFVPITPDALEDAGAVMESMGHNTNLSFTKRNKLVA
jgi:hypothetical protein